MTSPNFNPFSDSPYAGSVELSCTATVGGERVVVRQLLPEAAYADQRLREAVEVALRQKLMLAVLEKWTPVVKVRR